MNEEEAIFVTGKRLSELRNSGEDLPLDPIRVGNSLVLSDELADEYDKHFPPGPRRHKQVTSRIFHYSRVVSRDCRGELMGIHIVSEGRAINVLENAGIMACNCQGELRNRIKTSICNRYDVIEGDYDTFVIDKLEDLISVAKARFRVDDVTFCQETPIAGEEHVYIRDSRSHHICTVHYPFSPFAEFWSSWNGYVAFRKSQIAELRESNKSEMATPRKPSD